VRLLVVPDDGCYGIVPNTEWQDGLLNVCAGARSQGPKLCAGAHGWWVGGWVAVLLTHADRSLLPCACPIITPPTPH